MKRYNNQSGFIDRLKQEVGRIIIGQNQMLDRLLIGLLTNGHILLEGVPGFAKTLTIKSSFAGGPGEIQPHPVYSRPFARRCHRYHDLQSAEARIHCEKGSDLRQFYSGG